MKRKIRYKSIPKDLEKMVKPDDNSNLRHSIGLERSVGEFFFISVNDLIPFHNQARTNLDEEAIKSLSESIRQYGVRQPLTVLLNNKKYEVVSGERRLKAAKMAGIEKVPCIVIHDSEQAESIALVENIHRKDLHPIELGRTYKKLLDKKIFLNQLELAKKISVNKSCISEYVKYANFPLEIQQYIIDHQIISRDKLRHAIKAYENNDLELLKNIIKINKNQKVSFSVLRIAWCQGEIKFQETGIKKLSSSAKKKLKEYLIQILEKL